MKRLFTKTTLWIIGWLPALGLILVLGKASSNAAVSEPFIYTASPDCMQFSSCELQTSLGFDNEVYAVGIGASITNNLTATVYLPIVANNFPLAIGHVDMPWLPQDITVVNGHAYVALCEGIPENPYVFRGGLQIVDISSPTLPSKLGSYVGGYCVWETAVNGKYAYVADVSSRGGSLMIVDISDPISPSLVSSWSLFGGVSNVAVAEGHAYVGLGYWGAGLIVLDVSIPTNPTVVREHPVSEFVEDIVVHTNRIYLAASNGLHILDRTTLNEIGFYPAPERLSSVAVQGEYVYVVSRYGNLYIVDISDLANPTEIGSYDITTDYSPVDIAVVGKYLYFPAGYNGVRILDVSAPEAPIEVAFYSMPGAAYSVAVDWNYAYVANSDGVSIFASLRSTNHTSLLHSE